MKRKRKEGRTVTAACQLRSGSIHPFGAMHSFVPLGGGEERIYQQMRESIPVLVDAGIDPRAGRCSCQNGAAVRRISGTLP